MQPHRHLSSGVPPSGPPRRSLRWLVAYDRLAESIRLIEHGVPEAPARLSRRRRFAPLAVDVDGDVAASLFVVRGAGHFRQEAHVLVRRSGTWTMLGGGGGSKIGRAHV